MFQFQFTFEFEFDYQSSFSGEVMTQYFPMLVTSEWKRILFHVMACHDGSY